MSWKHGDRVAGDDDRARIGDLAVHVVRSVSRTNHAGVDERFREPHGAVFERNPAGSGEDALGVVGEAGQELHFAAIDRGRALVGDVAGELQQVVGSDFQRAGRAKANAAADESRAADVCR